MSAQQAHELVGQYALESREYTQWLLDEVGMDAESFAREPFDLLLRLESYVEEFPPEGLDLTGIVKGVDEDDPWFWLRTAFSACFAEILVGRHGGRWEVEQDTDDPSDWAIVVTVAGLDGRVRSVDPLTVLPQYFDSENTDVYRAMVRSLDEAGVTPWHDPGHPDRPDSSGRPLTPVQQWIVGTCAPLAAMNGYRHDRLGASREETLMDRLTALELLFGAWGSFRPSDVRAQIDSLISHGHRADFDQSGVLAAALGERERAEYVRLLRQARRAGAAQELTDALVDVLARLITLRFGAAAQWLLPLLVLTLTGEDVPAPEPAKTELERYLHQVLLEPGFADAEARRLTLYADPSFQANHGRHMIWDFGRAVMLFRWAHMVGWFTEQECWDPLLRVAREIQRHYVSWQDMAACYLQARLLWGGGGAESQARYEQIVRDLAADRDSPWNRVPWNLDLHQDW
ncbi:DUF1266 domain-containing protein [Thermomonospora amylolytica]|uniref:DUF1266 domain-containing protein n=1 Tax=Thermomonospora amylolytica TaxID=1411117 RepID=UPI000E6BE751|nr:DUF1266 domain-containing protein [Thermomonospora amylolytica]